MKKPKTRTLFTIISIITVSIFTIAVLLVSNAGNTVPDALIYCVYAYNIVIAVISGVISVKKIKNIEIMDLLKAEFKEDNE